MTRTGEGESPTEGPAGPSSDIAPPSSGSDDERPGEAGSAKSSLSMRRLVDDDEAAREMDRVMAEAAAQSMAAAKILAEDAASSGMRPLASRRAVTGEHSTAAISGEHSRRAVTGEHAPATTSGEPSGAAVSGDHSAARDPEQEMHGLMRDVVPSDESAANEPPVRAKDRSVPMRKAVAEAIASSSARHNDSTTSEVLRAAGLPKLLPRPAPEPTKHAGVIVGALVGVVAIAAWWVLRDPGSASVSPNTTDRVASVEAGERPPTDPAARAVVPPTDPHDATAHDEGVEPGDAHESGSRAGFDDDGEAGGGDPRAVPPATPPEIASVFQRIPVSPADRPPIGGIGKSGIHLDRLSMGTGYADGRCQGRSSTFSVSQSKLANVCLRAVHHRGIEEDVTVVWHAADGATRRSKMAIKPMHAYRTRAYLILRKEYVGTWTVRILSADGVELGTQQFTVIP